jgi:LytS/YehU family sensor histidine kinase
MGLYYAFDYHRRFRDRELVAAQLETQLTTAHLQALRMQLHPHFLFNALHSAAMLTMIDPEGAHRVLVQLSALLRTTLDRSAAAEVPLAEEIDFVDRYLAIEQIRFQDRLRVEIQADDDALSATVPNLILQPLVENAVRHGIARRTGARCLTIRGHRQNGSLVLEVEDDGPGLPGGWTIGRPQAGGGVGLTNVRARLERMYGADGRLELLAPAGEDGKPRQGVLARVTIPYRPARVVRHPPADPLIASAEHVPG